MRHLQLLLVIVGVMVFANVPAGTNEYDLHQAVIDNNVQLVKRLLSKGKAIDVIGSRKYGYGSALHLAVREGHVEIAQVLIDRGAQVDVLDPDDFTPLHNAAWNGNLEMTNLLLDAGADINASTYDGDTPLKLAQNNDQAQVAEFILVKLQPSPTSEVKVESVATNDTGVIDVSGTYLVDVSGEPTFIKHILSGARLEDRPVFEMVQKGDQITVINSSAESAGFYGPIIASLDGNTVNMTWPDARGAMTIKPGGKELVGTIVYTGGDSRIKFNAELKLTKIESVPAQIVDISGTYISEMTGPYRKYMGLIGGNPEVKLVQEGSKVTGTFESGGKLWGDVNGDSIELDYFLNGYQGKVSWKVKPGGDEVVGTWAYKETTGKDGNWTLTRIE